MIFVECRPQSPLSKRNLNDATTAISELDTTVTAIERNLNATATAISELDGTVTAIETNLNVTATAISELGANVTAFETNLNDRLDTIETNLNARLDAIEQLLMNLSGCQQAGNDQDTSEQDSSIKSGKKNRGMLSAP